MRPTSRKINTTLIFWITGLVLSICISGFAQLPAADTLTDLPPGTNLERQMTGAETHRYKFDLKKGEFFQVRVEQKGVDVALKLRDSSGKVLATMDSPNGKEGLETLTWVADAKGRFMLEVSNSDSTIAKAAYVANRAVSRTATMLDLRRVELESVFVHGVKAAQTDGQSVLDKLEEALSGWKGLGEGDLASMTQRTIASIKLQVRVKSLIADFNLPGTLVSEAGRLYRIGTPESILAASAKYAEAQDRSRTFFIRLDDPSLADILKGDTRADWKDLTKGYELNAVVGIINTLRLTKEWAKSISYSKRALEIIKEMRENKEIASSNSFKVRPIPLKISEADIYSTIGTVLSLNLNKPLEGLVYAKQALTLWREIQTENEKFRSTAEFREAQTLDMIAQTYYKIDDLQNALYYFEQELNIYRKRLPDQKEPLAETYQQLGNLYLRWLDHKNARDYWIEAVKIYEELGNQPMKGSLLGQIGLSYLSVNNEAKAREFFTQEMEILASPDYIKRLETGQKSAMPLPAEFQSGSSDTSKTRVFYRDNLEWQRWVSVGNIHSFLEENDKALIDFEKSLTFAKAANNQNMTRLSFTFIGNAHLNKGNLQKALDYYRLSLSISRQLPQKSDVASDLSSLAYVYIEMKNWREVLANASDALLIYQSIAANTDRLVVGLSGVMNMKARAHDELGNRKLAIFFEKQAVNAIQRERQQLGTLDLISQRGYLKRNERPYRRLAEWLIAEGRLPEAQQVLNSFKDQEFFDFDRSQTKHTPSLTLTPRETETASLYKELVDRVSMINRQIEELKRNIENGQPSAETETQIGKLDEDLKVATDDLAAFLKEAETEFSKPSDNRDRIDDIPDVSQMQTSLRELNRQTGQKAVAVYQVVGDGKFNALLITPVSIEKIEVPAKGSELNDKALKLWALLQSDRYDVTKVSKQIYDVVYKPLEEKLPKGTATIIWSLDGNLRYIPMGALFDGKKFLAERYQHVIFTRADGERMTRAVSPVWTGTAFGSSQARTVDLLGDGNKDTFPALPGVTRELGSIFRKNNKGPGILSGNVFSDRQFTETAFFDAMKQQKPLVHISSHFAFRPGDDSRSFLLLGDGFLTLNDLKKHADLFKGVELLTLSACNTAATQPDANGKEIDGFAELAQRLGAGAVLATLWQVSDASTPWLMRDFYATRQAKPGTTKAEALQKAQLGLLNDTAKIKLSGSTTKGPAVSNVKIVVTPDGKPDDPTRGVKVVYISEKDAPLFTKDTRKPYAHPFYWAPFVLIGNWR